MVKPFPHQSLYPIHGSYGKGRDSGHGVRLELLLLLLLNACVRVADVMIFTFVSLMPVHNVCRICMIIKQ